MRHFGIATFVLLLVVPLRCGQAIQVEDLTANTSRSPGLDAVRRGLAGNSIPMSVPASDACSLVASSTNGFSRTGRPVGQRKDRVRRNGAHRLCRQAARLAPCLPLEGSRVGSRRQAERVEQAGLLGMGLLKAGDWTAR